MKKFLLSIKTLTVASMKMYFRNFGAVMFTLVFPLALLGVFGFLSKSSGPIINIHLTNHSQTEFAKTFVDSLGKVEAFKIEQVSESEAMDALSKGKTDLQVIVPENFGAADEAGKIQPDKIITHFNQAKPQNGQIADLIIGQIIADINGKISGSPQIISVDSSGVQANNLNYFDFVLPGILAMTIMQLGIFGVAFAFVSLKASGALKRLHATPVHPRNFIIAQAITRLFITLLSIAILVALGVKFFNFHMQGSFLTFGIVCTLGILVFLGIGFGVAGWAKDENQVAPVANLIQLPMLLLSGIFFPRDSFPAWLKTVTDYLPLTYLTDAMRHIANEGQTLAQLGWPMLALAIWGIIIYFIAIKVFRWE